MALSKDYSTLIKKMPASSRKTLRAVAQYSHEHLSDFSRMTKESYTQHCLEVAQTILELTDDPQIIAVALLHDLSVHPNGAELIEQSPLDRRGKWLVTQMGKLRRLHIDTNTEDMDRFLTAFTADPALLPLRMGHRLNDVRHLYRFSKELRQIVAIETLHMYTAIAGRVGMHVWRYEMEDTTFRFLQPKIATALLRHIEQAKPFDDVCLQHASRFLRKRLRDAGIHPRIECRIKQLYSTYRKMTIKNRAFNELTDRLAIRLIVDDVEDCYRSLGVVHTHMRPIPGKLKDYIGAPKENGYRSIHTVVYPLPGVTDRSIEIQIRTQRMHEECEYGIARHSEYKDSIYSLRSSVGRVNLIRNLQHLRTSATSPAHFSQALREYFQDGVIVVFDSDGSVYHLRSPLTALDFACHVHGKRCARLKTLRINGREQPFDFRLSDGDTVEIHFARSTTAHESWLDSCDKRSSRQLIRELLEE